MDNPPRPHHNSMDGQGGQIWPSTTSGASGTPSSSATMNSPAMSQSPGSQLTMDLLQNFLNMQGLGDSIIQQQLSAGAQSPPTQARPHSPQNSASSSPNFSAHPPSNLLVEQQIKLSQLQQLQQLQNQIFQQQIALISGQSPVILPSPSILTTLPLDPSRQASRGADTSNKSTPADSGMYLPTPGPSGEIRPQQLEFDVSPNGAIPNFMEPLPHALVPPPASGSRDSSRPTSDRNQLQQQTPPIASSSGGVPLNLNLQRQLHAISQSHRTPAGGSNNGSFPSSPVYHPTSPMHHPVSPMHQSPNPFGQQSHHRNQSSQQYPPSQGHPSQPHSRMNGLGGPNAVAHSAPERVAFNIYNSGLSGGGQIPGLTLGPAGVPLGGMEGASGQSGHASGHNYTSGRRTSVSDSSGSLHAPNRQVHHLQPHIYHGNMQMPILDQDISPLTSPWLGAHPTSSHLQDGSSHQSSANSSSSGLRHEHRSSASLSNSNKRTASSSGDEGGSARKKQSPAIRPTIAIGMSIARLVSDKERERESGSTSPLALNDRKSGKMRLGGEREEAEKRGSSWSSASGSGSVSPDPMRGAGEHQEDNSNMHHRNSSFASDATISSNANGNSNHGSNHEATTPTSSNVNTNSFRPYRGSKSTNSTPLLRSTPSSALALSMSSMTSGGRNGGHTGRTRSKSRPGSVPMHASIPDIHDSPSPVDLNADRSMPPPPLPPSRQNDESGIETRRAEAGPNVGMGGMMEGVESMNMGGLSDINGSSMGMNFSGMMNNMSGMGDGMGSMNMGMNMGMGVNMDMGMDMGMEGMGIPNFSSNMGSMDIMNMSGMEFAHQQQESSHSHHDQQQQQQQHADHHQQQDAHHDQQQRQQYQQHQQHQQPLVPVTPASIMNLGRLGISSTAGGGGRLGSASAHAASTGGAPGPTASGSGTTPVKKGGRKEGLTRGVATTAAATRSTRTSTRNKSAAAIANTISPSLKPLLPAHNTPNLDATLPSPMGSTALGSSQMSGGTIVAPAGPVMQVRKTSHKAAEQKRRDSLKTTFDDLRKLLPPIALANDPDVDPNLITSPLFHATTPLLPGALPPRGPPKAGGDGPNKGVSKLQLLICGNEYIRLLTKRVERRDDEIEKLRREVKCLRTLVETKGEDVEDIEGRDGEQLDLERDLDAIERANMGAATGQTNCVGDPSGTNDAGAAEDAMDEADDDADD